MFHVPLTIYAKKKKKIECMTGKNILRDDLIKIETHIHPVCIIRHSEINIKYILRRALIKT